MADETCKHCHRPIENTLHTEGLYAGKHRCDPADSRLLYGYEAEPEGTDCSASCMGYTRELYGHEFATQRGTTIGLTPYPEDPRQACLTLTAPGSGVPVTMSTTIRLVEVMLTATEMRELAGRLYTMADYADKKGA